MELINRKIKVHKSLHELFGQETTWFDLFAILLGSILLTIVTQILCIESELTTAKKIVLAVLTLDIGGGVIANFTEGTNNYYSENIKIRYLFILTHFLQPLVLLWIFTENLFFILIITLFTLISSMIVTVIKDYGIQRIAAISFLLIGVLISFLLPFSNQVLQLILIVYSIKLILAFSVNWNSR